MDQILKKVDTIATRDKKISSVLGDLRESIQALAMKLQSGANPVEIDRLIREVGADNVKQGSTLDENIEILRKVYGDFSKIEEMLKVNDTLADSETKSNKMSATSGTSMNKAELQSKMQAFYGGLMSLEKGMQQYIAAKHDEMDSVADSSVLEGLESAFDSGPMNSEEEKKKIEAFLLNLQQINTALEQPADGAESIAMSDFSKTQNSVLGSERQDSFRNSPQKSLSSFISEASAHTMNEATKQSMKKTFENLYSGLGKLVELMNDYDGVRSVAYSNFQSSVRDQHELAHDHPEPAPQAFDFKKPPTVLGEGLKKRISIEVPSSDQFIKKHDDKTYPQSTRHDKKNQPFEKQMSQRNFTSNDPRRKQSDVEMDSVEDLKLEEKPLLIAADKPPQKANNSAQGSLDQSIFSGDTPDYFYEMRKAAEDESPDKEPDNYRSEPRLRTSPSRELDRQFEEAQDINSIIQSSLPHTKTNPASVVEPGHVIRFDSHQSKSEREIRRELERHTSKPEPSQPAEALPAKPQEASIEDARERSFKSGNSQLGNRSFKADPQRRQDTPIADRYPPEDAESLAVVPQLTAMEGDPVPQELPRLAASPNSGPVSAPAAVYDEASVPLPLFRPERRLEFIGSSYLFEGSKEHLTPLLRQYSQTLRRIVTSSFIDFDFPPLVDNIVDDLRDPQVARERRMEWRRLKFLCRDHAHKLWDRGLPYKAAESCGSGSLVVRAVEQLLSERRFEELYLGGSFSRGLHDFALFDSLGERVAVRVDDFVPVEVLEGGKPQAAFLQPAVRDGSAYFFPALLEKALSKLFGGYLLLQKAPLLSLHYCLYGPTPLSASLDRSQAFLLRPEQNCFAFTATKEDFQLSLFLLVDPRQSHKARDSLVHIEVFDEDAGLCLREERPAATLGLLRFQLKARGKHFFAVKFEDFRVVVRLPVAEEVKEPRLLDAEECMKLRRAFVRRFPFSQMDTEVLREVSLQHEAKGSSVLCRIQNFSKAKDKPVRVLGVEDWKDWSVEFNGNNIKKGQGRFISTAGNEEEYLRIFATRQVEAEVFERLRILIN